MDAIVEYREELITAFFETLRMVSVTLLVGGLLGLCLGLGLYATRRGNLMQNRVVYTILNILVNIVRPIPFIIFLTAIAPVTLGVIGTTIGTEAAIFAMTLMASFVIGRVVEQNLVGVDPGIVEAARAMGASRLRILFAVVVPEALAPLILGYTFIFVGIVDMSAMAGAIGGGGLGDFAIQYGYQQFNYTVTFVTMAIIIIVVQLAQVLGNYLSRRVLHQTR